MIHVPKTTSGPDMETVGDRIRALIDRGAQLDRQRKAKRGDVMSERLLGRLLRDKTGTNKPSDAIVHKWCANESAVSIEWMKSIAEVFHERYNFGGDWRWLLGGGFAERPAKGDIELLKRAMRITREIYARQPRQALTEDELLEIGWMAYERALDCSGDIDAENIERTIRLSNK